MQRRLRRSALDLLATEYEAGRSLREIAETLSIHHRTVAAHLEQLGVQRRVNRRKMSAHDVLEASRRYEAGDSLATVAGTFSVDPSTVRRELWQAGIAIRPLRGWA